MNVTLRYLGQSRLADLGTSRSLLFAPNLARDPVAFDGALASPLRFREAISALHDVVISDLRFRPRDKSAYEAWKREEQHRTASLRRQAYEQAKKEILARRGEVPADLERKYNVSLKRYWKARQTYSNYLVKHDPELWRMLMPCDPVITVADDVVFFECFSADESSYGCLTVDRGGGFGQSADWQYGTTNVDYSWDLYHSFQTLRSYRETRFRVDPAGFEVATQGAAELSRGEDRPAPRLAARLHADPGGDGAADAQGHALARGGLFAPGVAEAAQGPHEPAGVAVRAAPRPPPTLVLEPWEQRIVSHATRYDGPAGEPIRIWGRQRLLVLARLLPLAERFDVYLLGTGLPSFWVAQMGEMRLTLGLSGWTTNDWTRGSALDLLAPPATPRTGLDRPHRRLRAGSQGGRAGADSQQLSHRCRRSGGGAEPAGARRPGDLRPGRGRLSLAADHAPGARRSGARPGERGVARVARAR